MDDSSQEVMLFEPVDDFKTIIAQRCFSEGKDNRIEHANDMEYAGGDLQQVFDIGGSQMPPPQRQ